MASGDQSDPQLFDETTRLHDMEYENRTRLFDGDSFTKSTGTRVGSQTSSFDTNNMFRVSQHHHESACNFSTFGDTECGEPMQPQSIVLDFTPTAEDEIEEVRQKCIEFWEMFDNSPELQAMMVNPDPNFKDYFSEPSDHTEDAPATPAAPAEKPLKKEKTAMSFLEDLEERDELAGLLSCKMPGSGCSLRSKEYREHNPMQRGIKDIKIKQPCRCIGICNQNCRKRKKMTPPEVQLLSKTLNDWTLSNPKSMEPPGHPPELKHAVMQRKLSPVLPKIGKQ